MKWEYRLYRKAPDPKAWKVFVDGTYVGTVEQFRTYSKVTGTPVLRYLAKPRGGKRLTEPFLSKGGAAEALHHAYLTMVNQSDTVEA